MVLSMVAAAPLVSSSPLMVGVLGWRWALLLLGGQEDVLLLHLCHLLLEILVVGGEVGQLAMEIGVGGCELSDGRLARGFGCGKFLGSGRKIVVVVWIVGASKIGVVSGLLRCSMHGILYVVGLCEASF